MLEIRAIPAGMVMCARPGCDVAIPQARAAVAVTHGMCVDCNRRELHHANLRDDLPEPETLMAERRTSDSDGWSARNWAAQR